jgi:serine/threonine-protein kinase
MERVCPDSPAGHAGWALASAGDRAGAVAILDALKRESQTSYVSPVGFATIYLGLGERQLALDYTEKAFNERRGWLAYLKTNPIVDQLREEPRFQRLVERMKLALHEHRGGG